MAANCINRKAYRKELASLANAALVGVGKPVQVVYDHTPYSIKGQTPVVIVAPIGTNRKIGVVGTTSRVTAFNLNIYVYVAYAEVEDNTYTELQSADVLDDIEKAISDVLIDNTRYDNNGVVWEDLKMRGDTEVEEFVIGNTAYWRETIPVTLGRILG